MSESLYIPIEDSGDWVKVPVDNLKAVCNDVTDVLTAELSSLDLWRAFAVEAYKRDDIDTFLHILTSLDAEDAVEAYKSADNTEAKIRILNALVAHHIGHAVAQTSEEKKQAAFDAATGRLNDSYALSILEPQTWNCQGLLEIARYNAKQEGADLEKTIKTATDRFRNALKLDAQNIVALLGMACCLYHSGKTADALSSYAKALHVNPGLPAFVRVGLGLCYVKLQKTDLARAAFQRALELDFENKDAMVSLAILQLNSATPDMPKVVEYLTAAYEADPNHAPTLLLLANQLFYQHKYSTVTKLLKRAVHYATTVEMLAEAQFQLARLAHVQQRFDQAAQAYAKSLQYVPDAPLALFGSAQVAIHQGHKVQARRQLETLQKVKEYTQNFDVVRILGSLLATAGDTNKAIKLLTLAHQLDPSDLDVLLELGQVCELQRPAQAYEAYKKAVLLMRKQNLNVPTQLWNNYGVVCQSQGEYAAARVAFLNGASDTENLVALEAGTAVSPLSAADVTAAYNLSVNATKTGARAISLKLHTAIIASFPAYLDSYVHQAVSAIEHHQLPDALTLLETCLEVDPTHLAAQSMKAYVHLKRKESKEASSIFDQILGSSQGKDDSYAKLGLGHVRLQRVFNKQKRDHAKGVSSAEFKSAQKAGLYYRSVLKRQPGNVYAALGLGVVLAKQGYLHKARDVFLLCRDATPNMLDIWINLGHVYSKEQAWENATGAYKHCLTKFTHTNATEHSALLQCFALTLYQNSQMLECKQALSQALELTPNNDILKYDLAITKEHYAIAVLQLDRTKRTFAQVQSAVEDLKTGADLLNGLVAAREDVKTDVLREKAKSHAKFITDTLAAAVQHLDDARTRQDELQQQLASSKETQLALEVTFQAEEEAKLAVIAAEKARLEAVAKSSIAALAQLQESIPQTFIDDAEQEVVDHRQLTPEEKAARAEKRAKQRQSTIEFNPPGSKKRKRKQLTAPEEAEDDETVPADDAAAEDAALGMELDSDAEGEMDKRRAQRGAHLTKLISAQKDSGSAAAATGKKAKKLKKKKKSRLKKMVSSDDEEEPAVVAAVAQPSGVVVSSTNTQKKRKVVVEEEDVDEEEA